MHDTQPSAIEVQFSNFMCTLAMGYIEPVYALLILFHVIWYDMPNSIVKNKLLIRYNYRSQIPQAFRVHSHKFWLLFELEELKYLASESLASATGGSGIMKVRKNEPIYIGDTTSHTDSQR